MMQTTDVKLKLNKTLMEKAMKKVTKEFMIAKIKITDFIMIIILLFLYKKEPMSPRYIDAVVDDSTQLDESYTKTIAVNKVLWDKLVNSNNDKCNYSELINIVMAMYIRTPLKEYTRCIAPTYTFVGSKNNAMQKETADAVEKMNLNHCDMTLVDACCGTGALFFGLDTYDWKQVILNDLNPLRTNFLNVLNKKPLELIKLVLSSSLSFNNKKMELQEYRKSTSEYEEKRRKYHHVDCNINIALQTFLLQCVDKAHPESESQIFNRCLRFLPAHLKLINAHSIITKEDCKIFLENASTLKHSSNKIVLNSNRLLLLDPPYIGSENQCGVPDYNYEKFHKYTAKCLKKADYKFLYNCRSSAPKSEKILLPEEAEHAMKVNLGKYFFNKGFYFHNKELINRTNDETKKVNEVMISNMLYDPNSQFQWTDFHKDIFNSQSSDN